MNREEERRQQWQPKTAVALRYDQTKEDVPRVIATGRGHLAKKILQLAAKNDIPVYEDPTLAQLLASLELGTEIPAELYQVVAEVLAFVFRLDKKLGHPN